MLCWSQRECKTKFKFVTESYSWEFLTAIKTEHDARPTYLLNNRSISWLPIIRHTYCSILKLLNNFVAERHAPSQHGSNNTHCSQLQKPNKIDRFWCLIEFVSTFGVCSRWQIFIRKIDGRGNNSLRIRKPLSDLIGLMEHPLTIGDIETWNWLFVLQVRGIMQSLESRLVVSKWISKSFKNKKDNLSIWKG